MSSEQKLTTQATAILYRYGQAGLDLARKTMREEKVYHQQLHEAENYFMACFEDVLHPALLALACEAVGGKAEDTTELGAALVLLAGSADLHDDIIDRSTVKDGKPTVLGKYGKDLTILAGDALLFEGSYLLHKACNLYSLDQKETILGLLKDAFFRLSSVEATDASLRGSTAKADEVLGMIKAKTAVTEATMKAGVIIGKGTGASVETLGSFGKTFSILFALRDEFIDSFEIAEVTNRLQNECLPLPILVSLKNPQLAKQINEILSKKVITEPDLENLLDVVLESKETDEIRQMMCSMVQSEKQKVGVNFSEVKSFGVLLEAMIEDL